MVSAVIFAFVPESLPEHKHLPDSDQQQPGPDAHPPTTKTPSSTIAQLKALGNQLRTSLSIFRSRHLVLLLVSCVLTAPMTTSTAQFLVQFVAERYRVSFESTGYMQAANGVVQAVVALFALPYISHLMLRDNAPPFLRRGDEQTRDLALARFSFALLALSFVVMALAPVLAVFLLAFIALGLGSPGTSLLRSMMSLYVDAEHTSRLYSLVGMMEVLGNIYGSPMLAALFSWGMDRGEPWVGTPYLGIASLAMLVLVVMSLVRVPAKMLREGEVEA